MHQYQGAGVDEFVLDFTAADEAAYVEHLHRFADTVFRLLTGLDVVSPRGTR
ncbi:hypothetical protein AB0M20_37360 [Actinoplanes sp. NPDC051633]|uniref:hypothetical protein n=1 Tax=Actinoplanes sp. NPDC051633 TaxID=3155670 RepID=UPI0034364C7A